MPPSPKKKPNILNPRVVTVFHGPTDEVLAPLVARREPIYGFYIGSLIVHTGIKELRILYYLY